MSDPVLVPYDEYKELIEIKNKYKKVLGRMRYWKARAEELNRENYGLKMSKQNLEKAVSVMWGYSSGNNRR